MTAETRARRGSASGLGRSAVAVLSTAALILAMAMLDGCALAMLNGAANSGGSTASTPAPARSRTDDAISTAVRSKLAADPAVKAFNLTVDTHDGVVTLRGQVASVGQRNAAAADARAVAGVTSVQNLITAK
jgi:hyperosmotically inducible periplasmic protein